MSGLTIRIKENQLQKIEKSLDRNSGTLIFVPFCRFVLSPAFQYNEAKEVEVCL